MNRRFANLCRAADGGFRPNVIPNPSCVRTRARSRAISRPDARSFRKTSREILFATLSTLASEASTYLDVRVRRIAIGALRDGKKSSSSVSRSTGDNLPSGGASRRAFPEWIKRASPTRLERSRESSRHRARARTRAIASRTSARSRCASKIASCSFRIDVTLYRPPRPVARARLERLEHAERPVGFYDWRFFFRIARLYRTLTVCTLSSPQSHASPRHAEISSQISRERPRRALAPTGRMDFGCVRSVASASSSSRARSSSARER